MPLRQLIKLSDAHPKFKHVAVCKLDALLALCEAPTCRRAQLLNYFGEPMADVACGNCDICHQPPGVWDGTIAAQKALSRIFRTGQHFDTAHLIDVLRGNHSEEVSQCGHDKISTFGIGRELSEKEWQAVFRQLTALGYRARDSEDHCSLRLTPAWRAVLKGEQIIHLRLLSQRKSIPSARHPPDSNLSNIQREQVSFLDRFLQTIPQNFPCVAQKQHNVA